MVIIQGTGTLSVTEPGRDRGTYFEDAEITVYGPVVHFTVHEKAHTASTTMCLIGWTGTPTVRVLGE